MGFWRGLFLYLFVRIFSVKSLMWFVLVVVIHILSRHLRTLSRLPSTNYGRGRPAFQGMKPLFDPVSVNIVDPTAQS